MGIQPLVIRSESELRNICSLGDGSLWVSAVNPPWIGRVNGSVVVELQKIMIDFLVRVEANKTEEDISFLRKRRERFIDSGVLLEDRCFGGLAFERESNDGAQERVGIQIDPGKMENNKSASRIKSV